MRITSTPTGQTLRVSEAPGSMVPTRFSLGLLLCINLFNYIDRYVLSAVEPLIAKDLLSPDDPNAQGKMGLLATAFMVSYMLTAPIFGWLGDRMRRWALIGIGVLLWSFASAASGISHETGLYLKSAGIGWLSGFGVLLITRCFVGVGEGAYGPIAPSIIADMYPVERRGQVMSWFYLAIPVGSALGYVLGGLIGPRFGWQWAFYAVLPPGLLLGIFCFFRREPAKAGVASKAGTASNAHHAFTFADVMVLLRTRSYVLNVAGMTAMTFALGGVSYWMPRYVAQRLVAQKLPAPIDWTSTLAESAMKDALAQASLTFGGIVVVTGIFATLLGGYISDYLKPRIPGSYFLVSGIAMLVGFPLFLGVLVTPFPYAWGVIALAVFCLFFNTGPTNTIVANVSPPAVRSSAFALCILCIHLFGDAFSPAIIGWMSDRFGSLNAGFGLVSVMILVGGVLWLCGTRYLEEDTRRAGGE